MNKLIRTARVLSTIAVISLLLIVTMPETGNDQLSFGEDKLTTKTTPAYRTSNLLWLGVADVVGSGQKPIYVDAGMWRIAISGEDINDVRWRETPDEIVITISGTLPDSSGTPTSALTN